MKNTFKIVGGFLVIIGVVTGVVLFLKFQDHRSSEKSTPSETVREEAPETSDPTPANLQSQFLAEALKSPEALEAQEDSRRVTLEAKPSSCAYKVEEDPSSDGEPLSPSEEPKIVASISPDLPLEDREATRAQEILKDFVSLRKEAIRNPDSPQNRATIESIIAKRKKRLGQEE